MAAFQYEVIHRTTGVSSNGVVDADSADEARTQLKGQGYLVVELKEGRTANREIKLGGKKVKLKDVAWAARNLATTQTAGLPIPRALKMLAAQRKGDAIGTVLNRIQDDIINGRSLGEAFAREEQHLGRLMTAMVQAGEQSGKLHESLAKLADLVEANVRLKRKVLSAMTYPVVMMLMVFMIFMAMLLFVVPTFAGIYDQIDGELPKITSFLMGASQFIKSRIIFFPFIVVGLAAGLKAAKKSAKVKSKKDQLILKMPMFGSLFKSAIMARLATTLSSSLAAGVQLLDALQLAGEVANNEVYAKALAVARDDVRNGKSMGNAMRGQKAIPEMFTALIDIGEETGQVDALLNKYSQILEEEVETKVEGITSLIEPVMIVVFGGLVGVMVIALYLPLINIFKFLK